MLSSRIKKEALLHGYDFNEIILNKKESLLFNDTGYFLSSKAEDLDILNNLEDISIIRLCKIKITADIKEFEKYAFKNTKYFDFSECSLRTLPIINAPILQHLYLEENNITDISGITRYAQLQSLYLHGNDNIENLDLLLTLTCPFEYLTFYTKDLDLSKRIFARFKDSLQYFSNYCDGK